MRQVQVLAGKYQITVWSNGDNVWIDVMRPESQDEHDHWHGPEVSVSCERLLADAELVQQADASVRKAIAAMRDEDGP